jgi:hypothetical protein
MLQLRLLTLLKCMHVHCTVTVPVYTVLAERNGQIQRKRLS